MAEAESSKTALEEKIAHLETEIVMKRELVASMEAHPESDPDVVVVDDDSVKSRPERLYELYGKLGLNSFSAVVPRIGLQRDGDERIPGRSSRDQRTCVDEGGGGGF